MDSSIGNEDVIILHQRLQKSVKRINSVLTCPSSVAAEEFLCNWDVEDSWKSLPRKLGVLTERLLEQDLLSGRDGDSYFSPRVTFSSAIFSRVASSRSLEKNLTWSFQRLFSLSLEAHDKRWREMNQATDMLTEDDEDEEEKYKGDEGENDYDIDFDSLFSSLRKLGWLPSCYMVHKALRMAMYDVNEYKIRKLICSRYETYGMWGAVLEWKKNVLGPWLFQKVLKISTEDDNDNWKLKIDLLVATSFVHVRMEELFTIITEYPDSKPAVEELREALVYSTTPAQMMRLATSLKENLQRRLLHPGANTAQILDVYISAIKVLRAIDAEGNNNNNGQQQLLLETVTEPIKKYLRARSDTVRCIILGLTDEKAGGDLYEELRRQDATLLESGYETEDDEVPPDPNWVPSSTPQQQALAAALASHCQSSKTIPISASDRMKQQQRPQEDILSMLVSIYGSQELFVNEYRMMLSDKLLANLDFDTDKEVHTLELLKLRFGETSLRQCEIMIKDIDDSKRIVSNIHSTIAAAQRESRNLSMVVDAAIVSHIFWPPLLKDDMKAHPKIQSQLDLFGKEYANLKNPRKLIWLHQLGTVTVELEFLDDQSNHGRALPKGFKTKKEFTCSPIQATLITHFEDKESWTAVDLARETNVSEETIRRKMGYWLNQRVVQCRDTTVDDLVHRGGRTATILYTLCSSFLSGDAFNEQLGSSFSEDGNTEIMAEYDEYEDNAIQAKAQEAEEMKVYESYIVGMLTNLGPLPLERIHNMLKMFVTGSELKYDKTPQELSSFLDYLCNQDKLEYSDRMYKLVKK